MKVNGLTILLGVVLISAQVGLALTYQQSNTRQRDPEVYYRFGKITIDGAQSLTSDQIMRIAGIKSNAFASPAVVDSAAEVIKRAYLNRGHVRAQVQVTPDYQVTSPRLKQGLVELAININEGSVFRLRRLEFMGNEETRDRTVRRKVRLQEGEPFSQQLLEESMSRINKLNIFQKLTLADVEINPDDRQQIIDVVFHLKEIKRAQNRR